MDRWTILSNCVGFDWDWGNSAKNWDKHGVTRAECEEVFFNRPVILADDARHSQDERRFRVLGKTNAQKRMFIAFTVRRNMIRVISAREMTPEERRSYKRHEKKK